MLGSNLNNLVLIDAGYDGIAEGLVRITMP